MMGCAVDDCRARSAAGAIHEWLICISMRRARGVLECNFVAVHFKGLFLSLAAA